MNRISISFSDETMIKLKKQVDLKQTSIAQYVRELVEFSLKIEEKSNEKFRYGDQKIGDAPLKEIYRSLLTWILETRLLARFLLENHPQIPEADRMKYLHKHKEKAIGYVEGMLKEN